MPVDVASLPRDGSAVWRPGSWQYPEVSQAYRGVYGPAPSLNPLKNFDPFGPVIRPPRPSNLSGSYYGDDYSADNRAVTAGALLLGALAGGGVVLLAAMLSDGEERDRGAVDLSEI